jgi:hypothetical protein
MGASWSKDQSEHLYFWVMIAFGVVGTVMTAYVRDISCSGHSAQLSGKANSE